MPRPSKWPSRSSISSLSNSCSNWLLRRPSASSSSLGSQLLDALERIVAAATNAGGRLIAVDAIDDTAHRFYCHHDFQPIKGSCRLLMKIATARAAIDR